MREESKKDLELLRERASRMEGLLDALLQYSRIGRKESELVEVDTEEVVSDSIETLDVPDKVEIIKQERLPNIYAPRAAMMRIFNNLIGNAIKHRPNRALKITISAKELEKEFRFTVQDDGDGIDPRFHEKIFQLYQTLKPKDELEANGIGLALVKKTIEFYGGRIWVESAKGEGARFIFTWPKKLKPPAK